MNKVSKQQRYAVGICIFKGENATNTMAWNFEHLVRWPTGSHDPLTTITSNTINMMWEYQLV